MHEWGGRFVVLLEAREMGIVLLRLLSKSNAAEQILEPGIVDASCCKIDLIDIVTKSNIGSRPLHMRTTRLLLTKWDGEPLSSTK